MKKLSTEEVKRIQLEILNVVASFCEENGINYWLDGGTLLGAIRHKGYIPWDDDIDIGMLRPDYDRFRALFNQKNDLYKFVCYENNSDFYVPHGKVCDIRTVLYEPDENGYKLNVNIDVFVYDNAPDDETKLKEMFDTRDRLRKIHTIQNYNIPTTGSKIKFLLKHIRRMAYLLFLPHITMRDMIENSKKYADTYTQRVGNFTSFTRTSCNKRVFDSFIDVEFEGRTYKAPVGYDEWLRSFYGNYMELPPENERVSQHSYKAFAVQD